MEERLQKIMARAGVASRRTAEEIILGGRVRVNGRTVTELGQKADARRDRIEVDGRRLVAEDLVYFVLHKPRNVVSTLHDPEGRPSVADYLRDAGARVYPIGRLDFATSGVLLATNDGDFAQALLHPRGGVPKTYVAKVHGIMDEHDLARWRDGVVLDDGPTLPAEVRLLRHEGDKTWLELTLREGRNQQIRRMGDATGWPVMRLARTSFAGVTSEGLRPGESRPLSVDELLEIRKMFGVPKRVRGAPSRPRSSRSSQGSGHRQDAKNAKSEKTKELGGLGVLAVHPSAGRRPARSERTGRFGKTPPGAATPAPPARGRERPGWKRGRS